MLRASAFKVDICYSQSNHGDLPTSSGVTPIVPYVMIMQDPRLSTNKFRADPLFSDYLIQTNSSSFSILSLISSRSTMKSHSMKDLFRETIFGRLVRLASRQKLFAYDEELDPSILQQYQPVDSESSSAHNIDGEQTYQKVGTVSDTQESFVAGQERSMTIDQEKGADHVLVTWGVNDPHNPRNWTTPKKAFVTFQICLLTTSIYIGSAIYTAGLQDVEAHFNISPVKALLGLTLFVIGYALGPMVWVCSSSSPLIVLFTPEACTS